MGISLCFPGSSLSFFSFFLFFTILFITISVLFSCKGIQQKLLKRSCPQNGAAHLPFLGVPHFLISRGREVGGLLPMKVSSPGSHCEGLGGGGLSGRLLSMVISEVPLRVGAGSWGILPQELKNSILSFLPQSEPNLPDRGSRELYLPRISPQGLGEGRSGGERLGP